MKVLTRCDRTRTQDWADLRALLQVAGAADLAEAESALHLIDARGAGRGRALLAELERFRGEMRAP